MFHFRCVKIVRWPPGGILAEKFKKYIFSLSFFSLLKFKVSNRSLFSLISFFFLGTSFFSFSRPRQKIKIGKKENFYFMRKWKKDWKMKSMRLSKKKFKMSGKLLKILPTLKYLFLPTWRCQLGNIRNNACFQALKCFQV